MLTKIKINDVEYLIDVAGALKSGLLKPALLPDNMRAGDIYKPTDNSAYYSMLLVQTTYDGDNSWQILGIGCRPNSDDFFRKLHTLDEIRAYLQAKNYKFAGNINERVVLLVQGAGS